jgi:glycosyltransferase involved in cell wall biosynthesis
MGISAAMIVKNEARCIERCIRSIQEAVDEIIVVDTGSTDGTIEILENLAAEIPTMQLHHFEWINDFSAARNFSLSKVSHKWAFVVDADDVLPAEDRHKVRKWTDRMDRKKKLAILCPIYTNTVNGEITATYTDTYFRLFPSHLRYQDMIHESIDGGALPVLETDIRLIHDGYDHNHVDLMEKRKRNLTLLQMNLTKDPENSRLWMQLGREMKEFDKDSARRYLDIAESKTDNPKLIHWINVSRKGL